MKQAYSGKYFVPSGAWGRCRLARFTVEEFSCHTAVVFE